MLNQPIPVTQSAHNFRPSRMQRSVLGLAVAAVISTSLGCAHGNNQNQGAYFGSMIGSLVGAATGVRQSDVLVGQLFGAIAGSVIGYWYDKQLTNRATVLSQGAPATFPRLSIEKGSINPDPIIAGHAVDWAVEYTAITPNAAQDITLTEVREIVSVTNEKTPLKRRTVSLKQGSHESKVKLTFPKDLAPGAYRMIVTLSFGDLTQSNEVPIKVLPYKLEEIGAL